jgi:hypothetical protein
MSALLVFALTLPGSSLPAATETAIRLVVIQGRLTAVDRQWWSIATSGGIAFQVDTSQASYQDAAGHPLPQPPLVGEAVVVVGIPEGLPDTLKAQVVSRIDMRVLRKEVDPT